MKTYVISLKTSSRRTSIKKQLDNMSIEFEFFDAIDGRNAKIDRYNRSRRIWTKGHELTAGENGCFASHRELWQTCVDIGTPILVLEDDVIIDKSLNSILEEIKPYINQISYIRLGRGPVKN